MSNGKRSQLAGYLIAVVAVGLALCFPLLLDPMRHASTSLFFAAVAAAAWYGLGPGLLATVLSAVAIDYFIIPPMFHLRLSVADTIRLGVFVLVAGLVSSLNARRKRLEEVFRRQQRNKDEFFNFLAHELRTPLVRVLHDLGTLRGSDTDRPGLERVLASMDRQLQIMNRFVEELSDVAAVGQGGLRLLKTSINLPELVGHAADTVRPLLTERNLRLSTQLPEAPLRLEADPLRLEQVLVNLLVNAARYTEPGGRIWLSVEGTAEEVVFRVRDTGIGFGPEMMPHLFDLFVEGKGLGVGLSLVRSLVEMHGGSVTASSPGLRKGSEFVVRLPVPPEPEGSRAKAA